MIKQEKLKEFNSCNACGKYNKQPNFDCGTKVEECGITYDYLVGNIHIRLCKQCAKDLICLLLKQLGE